MSRRKGFTIIEVLVATVIIGLGIFALMEAFNRGYLGSGQAEDYSLALSLAQEQMEEIRDLSFKAVNNSARGPVNGFPEFDREVSVTSVHADLKQVVVRTYWDVPNGENSVTLTAYVVNQ